MIASDPCHPVAIECDLSKQTCGVAHQSRRVELVWLALSAGIRPFREKFKKLLARFQSHVVAYAHREPIAARPYIVSAPNRESDKKESPLRTRNHVGALGNQEMRKSGE